MKLRSLLLVAAASVCTISCLDTPDLPNEPELTFVSATLIDSLDLLDTNTFCRLKVDFTDGDGDIGLERGDTFPPHNLGSIYYHNLLVDVYEKDSGEFKLADLDFPFHGRIGNLTPEGQNKTLIGTITYDMDLSGLDVDTFLLKVRLIDRALNISEEISTDPIVLED